jgi:hypothetical protein
MRSQRIRLSLYILTYSRRDKYARLARINTTVISATYPFHPKQATYQATVENSGAIAGPIPQRLPNPPRLSYPLKQPLNEVSNTAEQAPSQYASPFQRTFPFKQVSKKVSNTADMMAGPLLSRLHMSTSRFGQTPPTIPETHTHTAPSYPPR